MASNWVIGVDSEADNRPKRRTRPRPKRSFVEALKKKYCNPEDHEMTTKGVVIVFHGKPKPDGHSELGYLHNVVLSKCNIATSGLDGQNLKSLCPNVVDLDLSGNKLDTWTEVLPVIVQLNNLKFLNLSSNKLENTQTSLGEWHDDLPAIENLVLNTTYMSWLDVLALTSKLPALQELHLCGNDYTALPDCPMSGLENVECLRMNNNHIQSWTEIWKLKHLPKLKSLILSGNPLLDVFFHDLCILCNHDNKTDLDHSNHSNKELDNTECSQAQILDNTVIDNENIGENENQNKPENILQAIVDVKSQTNDTDIASETLTADVNKSSDHAVSDLNGNEKEEDAAIETWCREIINDVIAELEQERTNTISCTDSNNEDSDVRLNEDEQIKSDTTENNGLDPNNPGSSISQTPASENSAQGEELLKGDNSNIAHTDDGVYTNKAKAGNSTSTQCTCDNRRSPFVSLESLCLSETGLSKWKHLSAVRRFPALKSLRVQDVKLGSKLSREDRRKLFVASLPNIHHLNGSEVTATEREKSERHLLRHFGEKKNKPDIFTDLEKKHGKLPPLVDIDIRRGYQEWVTLPFLYQNKILCTETVSVRQPVGRLRMLIAQKLCLFASIKYIQMYHRYCSPHHYDRGYGELPQDFEQLNLDSLPLSRFDIMDGDEIHFDIVDHFSVGALKFLHMRTYIPGQIDDNEG